MGSHLLNSNLSSLNTSFNSLSNRTLIPPNSLSFPFHFKSLQGCNMCWVQRRPIIAGSCMNEESLICPLEWWEGRKNEDISQIYDAWCEEYAKTCSFRGEMLLSFRVFKGNYNYVRRHNAGGINDFCELTEEGMAAEVIMCKSDESWHEQLAKGQGNDKLIVVAFTSGVNHVT